MIQLLKRIKCLFKHDASNILLEYLGHSDGEIINTFTCCCCGKDVKLLLPNYVGDIRWKVKNKYPIYTGAFSSAYYKFNIC